MVDNWIREDMDNVFKRHAAIYQANGWRRKNLVQLMVTRAEYYDYSDKW